MGYSVTNGLTKKAKIIIRNQVASREEFEKFINYCNNRRLNPCEHCKFSRDCSLIKAFEHEKMPNSYGDHVDCIDIADFLIDFYEDMEEEV